jgi:hypothetical protein
MAMKSKPSARVYKTDRTPPRLVKGSANLENLPMGAERRRVQLMEKWRRRLWQCQNKWFTLLDPQYGELVRKLMFSMEHSERQWMARLFPHALVISWFFTGSVSKMEEMIASLFNGGLFIVNKTFLPEGVAPEQMLLFNPQVYPDGIKVEVIRGATLLSDFLQPVPESKPWIDEWISEEKMIHHLAEAELGKDGLTALLTSAKSGTEPSDMSQDTGDQMARTDEKISYW